MTNTFTLKKRILLGYLIPLGLFAAVSIAILIHARTLQATTDSVRAAQSIVQAAYEMQISFTEGVAAVRGYVLLQDDAYRSELSRARGDYAEKRELLESMVDDAAQKAMLLRMDAMRKNLLEHNDRLINQAASRRLRDVIDASGTRRTTELAAVLDRELGHFIDEEKKLLEERVTRQTQELNQLVILVAGAAVLAIILSLLAAIQIATRITRSVGEMVARMSVSTSEIAAMVDEHEHTATQQAAAVNETTTTVGELGASSRQSADQAESTALVAQQALEVATGGSTMAVQVAQSMTDLQQKVSSVAAQISRLSEQAGQIGGIARVVGELASETNMLALNAAVEAARAGEQGKGFAVVAAEVRKLAEQSKKSAERVHTVVAEIQKATNTAVMVTEDGTRTAGEVAAITQRTLAAFEEIATAAKSVSVSTQQVVLNSKQQAIALNQVSEAMQSLTAGAVQIATATQQTKQGVLNLNQVALDLKAVI
jgi:methyl-accepting chemotaxis protein